MLERYRAAPLSSSFALVGILGFAFTLIFWNYFTTRIFNESLAFTLVLFFLMLFIASMISMKRAPIENPAVADYMLQTTKSKIVPREKPIKRNLKPEIKKRLKSSKSKR